jgi:hypothetical protein
MGAVVTFSIIHYWAAGLTSQGSGSPILAFDGIFRTCGAALMILAWPFLVDNGVTLGHIASNALVPGGKLNPIAAVLLAETTLGVPGGPTGRLIGILIMLAFAIIILAIFITKIMLGAGLIAVASGMPLALALWPVPALSWLAGGLMRLCAALVAVQLAWAVEFGVYARIPRDFFHWAGAGAFVDKLIAPLTMIALLLLLLSTTSTILRMAGYSGGSFVGSMAPYFGSQVLLSAASRGAKPIISLLSPAGTGTPGSTDGGGDPGGSDEPGTPNKPTPGGGVGTQTPEPPVAVPRGGTPGPPSPDPSKNGRPNAGPRLAKDGIPTRTGQTEEDRKAFAMLERSRASGPLPKPTDVADALGTIEHSGFSARAVVDYVGSHPNDRVVMGRMSNASITPGVSPQAAGAFRTIGLAEPGVRADGIGLWQSRQTGSTGSRGGGEQAPEQPQPNPPPTQPPPTPTS